MEKACRQVAKVKELVGKRKPRQILSPDPYVSDGLQRSPDSPLPLHEIRNPVYGVILARYVKQTKDGSALQPDAVSDLLRELAFPDIAIHLFPDLIVAGEGVVVLPCADRNGETQPTFFNQSHTRSIAVERVDQVAFGAAFCCLFFALDWIRLGKMPFPEIIADAFNLNILR